MKQTKIKCPYCKSEQTVKRGLSPTQNRGKQQRYLCKGCKKTFIQDLGFWKMKHSEAKITSAIDLYFSNLSSRKVRNHFRRHLQHNASHETVLDWCRRYVLKVQKYVDTLQPEFSGEYYADETEIDRKGYKDIFWANVDWGTRYINGIHYSTHHSVEEAVTFLKKTTDNKQLPKFIQTDAAQFYPKAMHQLFYSKNTAKGNRQDKLMIQHRINNVSKTKKHNVRIETVFMKIKDRVDDFRGLKALWSAPILMAGIVLQHNYIESHTTTNKVPCELANLDLDVGQNRWLGLIKLATVNQ